tara:strand:- start:126 stop:272 length:147 start_codon:yes stop_codon:yes gene_type:complete
MKKASKLITRKQRKELRKDYAALKLKKRGITFEQFLTETIYLGKSNRS